MAKKAKNKIEKIGNGFGKVMGFLIEFSFTIFMNWFLIFFIGSKINDPFFIIFGIIIVSINGIIFFKLSKKKDYYGVILGTGLTFIVMGLILLLIGSCGVFL